MNTIFISAVGRTEAVKAQTLKTVTYSDFAAKKRESARRSRERCYTIIAGQPARDFRRGGSDPR